MSSSPAVTPLRDPRVLLDRTMKAWGGRQDLWVFSYAFLIWRPEFHADEQPRHEDGLTLGRLDI